MFALLTLKKKSITLNSCYYARHYNFFSQYVKELPPKDQDQPAPLSILMMCWTRTKYPFNALRADSHLFVPATPFYRSTSLVSNPKNFFCLMHSPPLPLKPLF
jgi:hypothetical protein